MQRQLEPELMLEAEQAMVYAEADFSAPHDAFVATFKEKHAAFSGAGLVLDLGCGPGDVACRFAHAYPGCRVIGLDGSPSMLYEGVRLRARWGEPGTRVTFIEGCLPDCDELPQVPYSAIISNSLLHHMHKPEAFWATIKNYAQAGCALLVMDLLRPASEAQARQMTHTYTAQEPPRLQEDFYHSLRAAFTLDEVKSQLQAAQLEHLQIAQTSDRHWVVWGTY
ncbi:Methyltransferase type 12 [Magnetococcus marinus MC-1]|uniref:Methyltransferase type 12 n=1 Tax=Magnetococcus marinus (strain ATCC BAA-1437 / JCM 17883 / MC-1) TaxID=156889 RepID=A0L871_MAGMM|nr:class I SAM-dependent methyltransferase [Magnetococcus marinus]ABK44164.1 Methyltransferase type 12 [Magnetococcus marinus MC-1]